MVEFVLGLWVAGAIYFATRSHRVPGVCWALMVLAWACLVLAGSAAARSTVLYLGGW